MLCILIIFAPLGIQCFKLARLMLFPFGAEVVSDFGKHPIANILWAVLIGWESALGFLFFGILLCITIIGIPFGKQCFKLAILEFAPFGATIR